MTRPPGSPTASRPNAGPTWARGHADRNGSLPPRRRVGQRRAVGGTDPSTGCRRRRSRARPWWWRPASTRSTSTLTSLRHHRVGRVAGPAGGAADPDDAAGPPGPAAPGGHGPGRRRHRRRRPHPTGGPTEGDGEIARLGRALNGMLDQIETAFAERARSEDRLRSFLADASHELRTPAHLHPGLRRTAAEGRAGRRRTAREPCAVPDRERSGADGRPGRRPAASWPERGRGPSRPARRGRPGRGRGRRGGRRPGPGLRPPHRIRRTVTGEVPVAGDDARLRPDHPQPVGQRPRPTPRGHAGRRRCGGRRGPGRASGAGPRAGA